MLTEQYENTDTKLQVQINYIIRYRELTKNK